MVFIIKIFYSILFLALGGALIKFRKNVHDRTGHWYWAEKYLGSGGTYLVLILFGLFLIFLGAIYPFGGLELLR
ncbi:hypothetical protein EOM39_01565 [Candidatus Gracilibacteria bacterium]|nr:hypothetical protein [Candidatus Gracilibacteria bacterium]